MVGSISHYVSITQTRIRQIYICIYINKHMITCNSCCLDLLLNIHLWPQGKK